MISLVYIYIQRKPEEEPRVQVRKTSVLGKELLEQIHRDISLTRLPSWIGRCPRDLGSARHGSLSADQWRTACTVNLVTSLVRLWGKAGSGTRFRDMLNNYMDLIVATKAATMRIMTPARIQEYHAHMYRYLTNAQRLYPHHGVSPNQHLCLHLPHLLQDFGPVHSWRSYAYERFNHILQEIKTNGIPGEFTML